ncbi:MAG: EamA family transporter [Candidatus Nanoarchaeia archaeon]
MWFIFALIAGIFFAVTSLLTRAYAKKRKDAWIMSFYFSFLCALILLPFFIYEFKFVNTWVFWGGLLLMGGILVVNNLVWFKASQTIDASTQSTISKLRLLWIALAGFFIFNDVLNIKIIIGMGLILLASVLVLDFKQWKISRSGVILIIISTFTITIYAILLKKLIGSAGALTLTFLVCFIPAMMNAMVIPNFFTRAKKAFSSIKLILAMSVAGVVANLALIKALSYNSLSGVYFIMDASLIVVLVGEHFFMNEKSRLGWKIVAVILAIAGAILIRGM